MSEDLLLRSGVASELLAVPETFTFFRLVVNYIKMSIFFLILKILLNCMRKSEYKNLL